MEEQFVLRVPPAVSGRIERLLNDSASSSEDKSLDLSFSEDGRTGTFAIGNDRFSASLLDLPTVVESYKTYDDNVLIKTADIGQVDDNGERGKRQCSRCSGVQTWPYPTNERCSKVKISPRARFKFVSVLQPEVVRRVEKDLQNIMAGGTAENIDILSFQEEDGYGYARNTSKKPVATPSTKPDVPEAGTVGGEPDGSDSDDSDDSI
ncbi:hypothetical protein BUALT_Bualt13G0121400 [Buddleja alternifolia]|uniref:TAFII55 protein conserved region domain-containing protein n=1 Tax=Buddleja alternifolia TaxID=168488 RepID=A0AAV6WL26_9LAMI|nr:hypothetical protein BUALT_Bualt13G0121400 [Buddleja alternifolia]